ncbi:unnamed protein product [Closterium sp. NIES-53]
MRDILVLLSVFIVVLGVACPSQAAIATMSPPKNGLSRPASQLESVGKAAVFRRLLRQEDVALLNDALTVREGEWVKVSDIVALEAGRAAESPPNSESAASQQGNGNAGLATVRSGNPEGTGGAEEKGRAGGGTGGAASGGDTMGAEKKEEEESGDDYVDDGEGDWAAQPGMRVQQTTNGEEIVDMFEHTATDAEMKELAQKSGHASAAQGGVQNGEQSGTSRAPASVLPLPLASANTPTADVARRKDSTGAGQRKGEQTTGQVPKQQIAQHGKPVVPQGGYIDVQKRQAAGEGGQLTDSRKQADNQQSPSKDSRGHGGGEVASGREDGMTKAGRASGGVGGNNDAGGDHPDGGDVGNDMGSDGSDTTGDDSGTTGADEVISLGGDVEGGDGDERDYGTDAETMSQASTAGTGMDVGNGNGQGYDSDSVIAAANDGGLDVGMMFLSSNSMVGKPVVGAGAGGRARKPPVGGTGKTGYEGERKAANHRTRTKPRFKAVDCQYREKGAFSKLHRCAVGYAGHAGVTGGYKRPIYLVTSDDDMVDNVAPGTIRFGLNRYCRSGVTIRFASSMLINLKQRLFLPAHTTIDGRGARVAINGGIVVHNVTNVIIHNVAVGNLPGDHDVIHISNSTRVWVDHCAVYNAIRGTVDVVYGSTDVTISNCYLRNKNLTMLLGADDGDMNDANMRVTVYRNWFDQSGQRQPKARWGQIHVANNLYTNWTYYCIGGRMYANIRSERNIFIAGTKRKEVTPWFGEKSLRTAGFDNTPSIRSYNDLLLNGATFHQFTGYTRPFLPPYALDIHRADKVLADFVRENAGPQVGRFTELACTELTCIQQGDEV